MKCPLCPGNLWGIEILGRYDGISHRQCQECKKNFSRGSKKEMEEDELCKYGKIYKVKEVGKYKYETISYREDKE